MQSQAGRLVTPEAVVLQVPHAGPGTRIAARGLDFLLQLAAYFLFLVALAIGAGGLNGGVALVVVSVVGLFLVFFGYPAIMEATWRGQTLGKAAFGLRVVTREGAPIRFRHAAIRAALYVVDGLLIGPVVGILCLLLTRDTVRLGDIVAGTIVIRERSGALVPTPTTFAAPPGYEAYVATLDVQSLTADDYSIVRGFLLRAWSLAPAVRYPLAQELARPIAAKLRVPSPPIHPEAFLLCVAAAAQQRYRSWGYRPTPPAQWGVSGVQSGISSVPPAQPAQWPQWSSPAVTAVPPAASPAVPAGWPAVPAGWPAVPAASPAASPPDDGGFVPPA